jgi:hypothetical protein
MYMACVMCAQMQCSVLCLVCLFSVLFVHAQLAGTEWTMGTRVDGALRPQMGH